jgi:hypothetical protein
MIAIWHVSRKKPLTHFGSGPGPAQYVRHALPGGGAVDHHWGGQVGSPFPWTRSSTLSRCQTSPGRTVVRGRDFSHDMGKNSPALRPAAGGPLAAVGSRPAGGSPRSSGVSNIRGNA